MKRFKKTILLLAALTVFAVLAMGSGSSDDSSAKKVGEVEKEETKEEAVDKEEVEAVEEETAAADSEQTEFRVGDTYSRKGLDIVYVSSENFKSDNQFMQPSAGKKFVRLAFHVDNRSGSDKSVTTFDFDCYADGYECDSRYFDDDLSASVSNGRTADGAIYFEVPEDAETVEIEYKPDLFSDKKVIFLFEGDVDSGFVPEKNTAVSDDAFRVGDIIENSDLRITYLAAAEYVSSNQFIKPAAGNKFIYAELEVENISKSDQFISSLSFACYADGVKCGGFYGMDDSLSATISAGRKAKGTVAFEVPRDAQTIEIEYEDNFWTDSKIILLYEE